MKQEIQIMPVNDIMSMAKVFAESGMFTDARQMSQAFVKIQAGQEIGIPPFAAMSGIHVIQGKTTLGAGIIASAVKGSGKYNYKVVEMSEKVCSIDFYEGGENIGNSKFTIEDAKKAGTKNLDKFPKNMLFARAISNGVKWYTPDVFSGPVYVPEEMEHLTQDVQHIEVNEAIAEPEIPQMTEKQFEKAMNANLDGVSAALRYLEAKKMLCTAEQYLMLQNKEMELKKAFELLKELDK